MRIIGNVKDSKSLQNNERLAQEQRNKLQYERMVEPTPAIDSETEVAKTTTEESEAEPKSRRSKKKVQ